MQQQQAQPTKRLDRDGSHRRAVDLHRKEIYRTQTHCGICGREVDFNQKFPSIRKLLAPQMGKRTIKPEPISPSDVLT